MDQLRRDVRDGWRSLTRDPGISLAIVVMLALGIGASSAIFTVVQAVAFKMQIHAPEAVVSLRGARSSERDFIGLTLRQHEEWIRGGGIFAETSAFALGSPVVTTSAGAERLSAELVTPELFEVLGTRPALGRVFTEADHAPAAVLSHRYWRSAFGSDRSVIGRQLVLDSVSTTVVGVMPPGFDGPRSRNSVDLWLPLDRAANSSTRITAYARLKPGDSLEAARARLDGLLPSWLGEPGARSDLRGLLEDPLYEDSMSQIWILVGGVALVLLIACLNVASLLIGRNLARRREFAVRVAVGADRVRVLRLLLTESALLSAAGAGLGLLLASWILSAITPLIPGTVPRVDRMQVDAGVAAFAIGTAALAALVVTLWPAWSVAGGDTSVSLRSGERGASRSGMRGRSLVVITEGALAMVALSGAMLLIASFQRLNPTDPGFDVADRTVFSIRFAGDRYGDERTRSAAVEAIAERLRAAAPTADVMVSSSLPLTNASGALPVRVVDGPVEVGRPPTIHFRSATPGFLTGMGMPILRGRDLDQRDGGAERTAVVNQAFVRRMLQDREPLGVQVALVDGSRTLTHQIVGVVRDARLFGSDLQPRPEVYLPYHQFPTEGVYFVVHSPAGPGPSEERIRRAVATVDGSLPAHRVQTLEALVAGSVDLPRFLAVLMTGFAIVALVLALIGLYAASSWAVTQRTREIGVRIALGARPADIRRMVLRQGARIGGLGVAIGAGAALASASVLESWLFGMPSRQPLQTLVLAAGFIALVMLASYLPARKATAVDPQVALRAE